MNAYHSSAIVVACLLSACGDAPTNPSVSSLPEERGQDVSFDGGGSDRDATEMPEVGLPPELGIWDEGPPPDESPSSPRQE